MALQSRKNAVAITVEVTEGTPVQPSAGSDFLPIQGDVDFSPSRNVLTNEELRDSIARSKPVIGLENPTASFSLYLKNSGTGGTAPQADEIYTALFGAEDIESTEYDTVAGSTTSVANVDSGEGANYREGQLLLVKHSIYDWEMRPVYSISSDALTPAFNFDNAPATGTNLGKAVTYYPADDSQQTLNLWNYLANGGNIEMIAGCRPVSMTMNFPAGGFINQSFSFEGTEYYWNPITIDADDTYLDFDEDGMTELTAQITAKTYKDPHELAAALESAMDSVATADITVTYSDTTGKFTIASDGGTFNLLWNTGTNTANTVGDAIGFTVAADDTGATSYVADNAITVAASQTPAFDDVDPLIAKDNEVFVGDAADNTCLQASNVSLTMNTPKTDIEDICATSGKSGSVINERNATIEVTYLLSQYDADKFKRYREGTQTRFLYNFGTKSGGNWVAGKSGCLYSPTCTVTNVEVTDNGGLIALVLTLQTYTDSNRTGEIFLSFV